ncbi:MAG: class I SAM-dependent methyltransferase [Candidatus Aminicenantaceae bacterium]
MGWKHEHIVPEEMDLNSEIQRVALKNHLKRYHVSRKWISGYFNGNKPLILDLACGTGFGSEILAEIGDVIGIDINEKSLEYAKTHYNKRNTKYIAGDADDINFRNKLVKFDAVVSLETIEHLKNHYSYLHWVKKSLYPGGLLIVSFPSTLTMDWAVPHHKRDISRREANRLFKEIGFKIIDTFDQADRIQLNHVFEERNTNPDVPAPPLSHWIKYYLKRPDHMFIRLFQIMAKNGILLAHQQYLLTPEK